MKIVSFDVVGLHGFLDVTVDFNDDLTIIVGRNGSGKTSALTLISDLIRLDTAALRKVPFTKSSILLSDDAIGSVCVSASNHDNERALTLSINESSATIPLDLPSDIFGRGLATPRFNFLFHNILASGSNPSAPPLPGQIELDNWAKLSKKFSDSTRLTFVRLDRTIVAVDPEGIERVEGQKSKPGKQIATDPIDEVLRVTAQKYGEYKQSVEEIKNTAFNDRKRAAAPPIALRVSRARSVSFAGADDDSHGRHSRHSKAGSATQHGDRAIRSYCGVARGGVDAGGVLCAARD